MNEKKTARNAAANDVPRLSPWSGCTGDTGYTRHNDSTNNPACQAWRRRWEAVGYPTIPLTPCAKTPLPGLSWQSMPSDVLWESAPEDANTASFQKRLSD